MPIMPPVADAATPPRADMLSVAQVAEEYGLGKPTVRRWVDQNILPAYRLGPKLIKIRRTDVEALMVPIDAGGDAA